MSGLYEHWDAASDGEPDACQAHGWPEPCPQCEAADLLLRILRKGTGRADATARLALAEELGVDQLAKMTPEEFERRLKERAS